MALSSFTDHVWIITLKTYLQPVFDALKKVKPYQSSRSDSLYTKDEEIWRLLVNLCIKQYRNKKWNILILLFLEIRKLISFMDESEFENTVA